MTRREEPRAQRAEPGALECSVSRLRQGFTLTWVDSRIYMDQQLLHGSPVPPCGNHIKGSCPYFPLTLSASELTLASHVTHREHGVAPSLGMCEYDKLTF